MPKKISRQYTGGWVDGTISDGALNLIKKELGNCDEFKAKLSVELGRYRDWKKFSDTAPSVSESINHLKKISNQSTELIESLNLIPSEATAIFEARLFQSSQEPFLYAEQRLKADLTMLKVLSNAVSKDLEALKGRRGVKSNSLEHSLLVKTTGLVEEYGAKTLNKTTTAWLAAQILIAAGISEMPGTPEKARAVVRKQTSP
jgi:hypothetical protein